MLIRTKRILKKALSFFIALSMAIYFIPSSVFAQEDQLSSDEKNVAEITEDISSPTNEESQDEEPYVLGEMESLRTETGKTFRMSDGTYIAVEYGKKIHFKDDNNKWQDYDNTISVVSSDELNKSVKSSNDLVKSGYKTNKNNVNFHFSNKKDTDSIIEINDGSYKIGIDFIGSVNQVQKKEADIKLQENQITVNNTKDNNIGYDKKLTINEAAKLTKYQSSVQYSDILDNIDLEYFAYGENIKENIIVKDKSDSYIYKFTLNTDGLIPKLNEDGSISLCEKDSVETIYIIPAGYMYDANGEYSDAVEYTLKKVCKDVYSFIITADSSWINADNRTFPVSIDPSIIKDTASYIKDTYVNSQYPSNSNGTSTYLYVSGATDSVHIAYLGMDLYPDIPRYAVWSAIIFIDS